MHTYDTWKTTLPEEYYGLEDSDFVSMDDHQPYLDAREWVEEAIDSVFKTGSVEDLERALEELACVYGVKFPSSPSLLEKKSNTLLEFAAGLTRAYAKVEECERLMMEAKLLG